MTLSSSEAASRRHSWTFGIHRKWHTFVSSCRLHGRCRGKKIDKRGESSLFRKRNITPPSSPNHLNKSAGVRTPSESILQADRVESHLSKMGLRSPPENGNLPTIVESASRRDKWVSKWTYNNNNNNCRGNRLYHKRIRWVTATVAWVTSSSLENDIIGLPYSPSLWLVFPTIDFVIVFHKQHCP